MPFSNFFWYNHIIDSYEHSENRGVPMGNQSSQWFALYYLDRLDRFIKERLKVKYYVRYMDDGVLIHHDKEFLKKALAKTQIFLYHREWISLDFIFI